MLELGLQALSVLLIVIGLFFFVAGTLGVLRFDSALNRLHAVTKADNLGLGFVIFGLALQAPDIFAVLKLFLIWLLVLVAAALLGHIIGQRCYQEPKS